MKKTNSVRLFFVLTALISLTALSLVAYLSTRSSVPLPVPTPISSQSETDPYQPYPVEETPDTAESTITIAPYLFLLREDEGYISIYGTDGISHFETTDIEVSTLSEELQIELINGKPIYSEAELYDFLENHSS